MKSVRERQSRAPSRPNDIRGLFSCLSGCWKFPPLSLTTLALWQRCWQSCIIQQGACLFVFTLSRAPCRQKQIPSIPACEQMRCRDVSPYCSRPLVFHTAAELAIWTRVCGRGRLWWIQADWRRFRYCSCLRKSNRTRNLENRLIHSIFCIFLQLTASMLFLMSLCYCLPQHQVSKWTVGDYLKSMIDTRHTVDTNWFSVHWTLNKERQNVTEYRHWSLENVLLKSDCL